MLCENNIYALTLLMLPMLLVFKFNKSNLKKCIQYEINLFIK